MNFNSEKNKKFALWIIGIITACIVIFLAIENIDVVLSAFSKLINLLSPLLIGLAFALVLNVPMSFIEEKLFSKTKNKFLLKAKKPISYVISLVLILGIFVGVISLVIPALVDAVKLIINEAMGFINKLSAMSETEIIISTLRMALRINK